MANTTKTTKFDSGDEIRLSGDSHVSEPLDLWEKNIAGKFRDRALTFPNVKLGTGHDSRAGGSDPVARLNDSAADGISAELLFATRGWNIFRQFYNAPVDVELSHACERVYNDWMIEYCEVAPDRLWGQAIVSLYDVDYAIGELQRVKTEGLKGVSTWVAPPKGLEWTTDHYERFWSAAEEAEVPVAMHINSGFGAYVNNNPNEMTSPMEIAARQTYIHKITAMQTVAELILSGVFERHPRLKVVLAEFECGWIPFFLEDMDRKVWVGSTGRNKDIGLKMLPSEYFARSIYSTLIQDGVGGYLLDRWGADNFLFANDYPHPGGIWPYSDETIALTMGNLSAETRRKVLGENLAKVYGQPMPAPVERVTSLDFDPATWPRPWLKSLETFTFDKPEFGFAEASESVRTNA